MGKIKKLKQSDFTPAVHQDTDIYPVTSTKAVFDIDGASLDDILNNMSKGIQSNGLSDLKATAQAFQSQTASASVNVVGNTLEFRFGLPKGADGTIPSVDIGQLINERVDEQLGLFSIQIIYSASSVTPVGGQWDGITLTPPTGWYADISDVSGNPVYMSIGKCWYNSTTQESPIEWSVPVSVTPNMNAPQSPIQTQVMVVYKVSATYPDTPTGGSFNWSTMTFTPPSGWSTDPVPDNDGWYSVRAFYSDETSSDWTVPQNVANATQSLSAAQLDIIAGKINVTTNMVKAAVQNLDWTGETGHIILDQLRLDAGALEVVARNITVSSQDLIEYVAPNIQLNAEQLSLVASGLGDGQLESIASIIIQDDSITSLVTNTVTGQTSSIIQTPEFIQATADNIIANAGFVQICADAITLTASDIVNIVTNGVVISDLGVGTGLTIKDNHNNNAIVLNSDGSGFVAKGNLSWTTDGAVQLKGTMLSQGLGSNTYNYTVTATSGNPGEDNTVRLTDDVDVAVISVNTSSASDVNFIIVPYSFGESDSLRNGKHVTILIHSVSSSSSYSTSPTFHVYFNNVPDHPGENAYVSVKYGIQMFYGPYQIPARGGGYQTLYRWFVYSID